MDLWSGSIPTGSFDLNIKLVNATPKRDHNIPPRSRLSFHSFVNPALIPLYARAGPSVEVHTANAESAEWLKTRLLGSLWLEEWGDDQEEAMERAAVEIQCPVALLLTVDSQASDISSNTNVSDLLVYGILTATSSQDQVADRLPSPSGSSPGDGDQLVESRRRDLRIYAAPLATSYVQKAQDLPSPPSSPIDSNNNTRSCEDGLAQFLPDLRSPNPKRKRMLSIFETAAQHHRRVRQYGGQAVSQMMATTKSQTHQTQTLKIKREPTDDRPGSSSNSSNNNKTGLDRLGGLRRARSLSVGGNQLARLESTRGAADESRPSSSRGLQQQARRMISKNDGGSHSFHEFERSRSIAPTSNLASSYKEAAAIDHDSSVLPSSSPKTGEMLVASNKDVITRTILTGMRLYGYHRKPSRATTKPATFVNSNELDGIGEDGALTPTMAEDYSRQSVTDEDDFKAMYHATYKAATFALRHYLKTDSNNNNNHDHDGNRGMQKPAGPAVLSRDTATNVIDEILKLFCDDQLKPAG